MKYYRPIYFGIKELVSKNIYEKYGDQAWIFFDPKILITADQIRQYFNVPMIVNNWATGGSRQYSGYREIDCNIGKENSQHRQGRALDIICSLSAKFMRKKILENSILFPFLKCMENSVDGKGISWLHIDCRNIDTKQPLLLDL